MFACMYLKNSTYSWAQFFVPYLMQDANSIQLFFLLSEIPQRWAVK